MKKFLIILTSIVLVLGFAYLVYWGFSLRYGPTLKKEVIEPKRISLEVPLIDQIIDLETGIALEVWNKIPSTNIELIYQMMILPWPKRGAITNAQIKAFHNDKDIYFYITWKDVSKNDQIKMGEFSDSTGIMFPLSDDVKASTLMMGFMNVSNIWYWKASNDAKYWYNKEYQTTTYADFHYPFENEELINNYKVEYDTAVRDLVAIRIGTITPKVEQIVTGRGYWQDDNWHVVFKRSLYTDDTEYGISFSPDKKRLCAIAIWEGEKEDRGGRKSISNWIELEIK